MEEDIIGKHMWPLTVTPPRYREAYLVSLADKLCALAEMARLYGPLDVRRNLGGCAAALRRGTVL
jgi:uncharacterized protein